MNFLIGLLPIIAKAFGITIPTALLAALPTLIATYSTIADAVRLGKSGLDAALAALPQLLPILQKIGHELFPNVVPELAYVAAAQAIYDPVSIKVVQNGLNMLGQMPALEVDGIPGPKTKAAVTAFQTANALEADGWPGPKTNAVIAAKLAALPAAVPAPAPVVP